MRTGEHIVATRTGTFTVSTVMQRSEGRQWSKELLKDVKGSPAEPVPGTGSRKLQAFVKKFEDEKQDEKVFMPAPMVEQQVRAAYIYKKDIIEFGATRGCPGCCAAIGNRQFRATHTLECRERFEKMFMESEAGRKRVQTAAQRMNDAVVRASGMRPDQDPDEPAPKRSRDATADEATVPSGGGGEASGGARQAGIHPPERSRGTLDPPQGPAEPPTNRKRRAEMEADDMPEDTPTSVRAAEMEADDMPEDTPTSVRAAVLGKGDRKRPAEVDAEDGHRGDEPQVGEATPDMETDAARDIGVIHEAQRRAPSRREPRRTPRSRRVASPAEATWVQNGHRDAVQNNRFVCTADSDENSTTCHRSDSITGSALESPPCADDGRWIGRVQDQDAVWQPIEPKPSPATQQAHPSPVVKKEDMRKGDFEWKDIGSGVFAKTFLQAERLTVSSKGGPPACEVARRVVRNLATGKIIDDCVPEDTSDSVLHRRLPHPEDIRIELTMRGALSMYNKIGPEVCELYSQSRIAQEAAISQYNGVRLRPGWSLDLTRNDPLTGMPWDLFTHASRERVRDLVRKTKPLMVIGSPPCVAFSNLQALSRNKRDCGIVKKEMGQAVGHLKFCMEIYRIQASAGRLFMHEHPHSASSWRRQEVIEIMTMPGVGTITIDMCAFGMVATDGDGEAPAKKSTNIMSNSPEVLKSVSRRCVNGDPSKKDEHHRHVQLTGGKAKACQVYPRAFCRAVCQGVASEKKLRELGMMSVDVMSVAEMMGVMGEKAQGDPSQELHEHVGEEAFDDTSGAPLVPSLVAEARKEEIEYFKAMKVYRKVHRDECWKATGKGPIQVRWVDINKGDDVHPNYRSRLVAKEFKTDVRPDLYAPTPPGECLRLMLSQLACRKNARLMYADVSRAYFYAKAVRPVYVVLPPEDRQPGDEELCGELVMSMYGTRDAALNWSAEYSETLIKSGYVQGRSNACLFHNPKLDVAVLVHGDDFVAVGSDRGLADARAALEGKYKLKVEMLGDGPGCTKEVRILNKVVRHTTAGIELEADPRHAELVIRELGLESAKVSRTPGTKDARRKPSTDEDGHGRLAVIDEDDYVQSLTENSVNKMSPIRSTAAEARRLVQNGERVEVRDHGPGVVRGVGCCRHGSGRVHVEYDDGTSHHCDIESIIGKGEMMRERNPIMSAEMPDDDIDEETVDEDDEPLGPVEARRYRAIAARLNYLVPDRIDIQYAVKESARAMSCPKAGDWPKLQRLGRYLLGRPRLVIEFPWQNSPSLVTAYTDSDWAGCAKTARSTSGGIVMIGDHVIKTYSKQQRTVALSSAEAELYAMVAASAEALAVIAYSADLGLKFDGEVYTDSSAALGISQRAGIGKVRHLRTQGLWVQECRVTGRLVYHKVLGTKNPADVLTKHVPGELLDRHLETVGARITSGRAASAPEVSSVESRTFELEWNECIDGGDGDRDCRRVRFDGTVKFRAVPSCNRGIQCGDGKASTRWQRSGGSAPGNAGRREGAGEDVNMNVKGEPSSCGARSAITACPECGGSALGRWSDISDDDECTACAASGALFALRPGRKKMSGRHCTSDFVAAGKAANVYSFSLDSVGDCEQCFVRQPKVICGVTRLPITNTYRIRPVRTRFAKTGCIRSRDYTGVNRPGHALLGASSGSRFRESGLYRAILSCVSVNRNSCSGQGSEGERLHTHPLTASAHTRAHMDAHICAARMNTSTRTRAE